MKETTMKIRNALILAVTLLFCTGVASADEIRVAVASNFSNAMKDIAELFEKRTGHRVILVFGSTGKHYAQIKNGAPFEAFIAADVLRPKLLEEEGIARSGSRFTYAIGKVVLWSPNSKLVDAKGKVLSSDTFRHLAIANPKLAPYGEAAEQVMRALGVRDVLERRIVRGEDIGQTFQFVRSGNAELGFVAYSQIKSPEVSAEGSFWEPPQSLYDPVEQQAVLLKDNAVARELLSFMKSGESLKIIRDYGYGTP
jgi:molybdate transport system substrate-binding protein